MKYLTWPPISDCKLVGTYNEKADCTDLLEAFDSIQEACTVTTFSGTVFLDIAFSGHTFSGEVMPFHAIPFQVKLSLQTLSSQTFPFLNLLNFCLVTKAF